MIDIEMLRRTLPKKKVAKKVDKVPEKMILSLAEDTLQKEEDIYDKIATKYDLVSEAAVEKARSEEIVNEFENENFIINEPNIDTLHLVTNKSMFEDDDELQEEKEEGYEGKGEGYEGKREGYEEEGQEYGEEGKVHEDEDEDEDEEEEEEDDADDDDEQYLQKFQSELNKKYLEQNHPECVIHNNKEVSILTQVVRNEHKIIVDDLHRTLPYLTKYEKTRVIGQRAKQIYMGSEPFIEVDPKIIDGYIIAEMELHQRKIPFIIRRPLPNGSSEYWNLKDLEII